MKNYLFISISIITLLFSSCSNGQSQKYKSNLSATEFSKKIADLPTVTIIDVRSSEEFEGGHIQNAQNFNWNGNDFDKQISTLDKSKPVLVYCLSGGRSSSAAKKMRNDGFKEVYELDGGMMQWRNSNLPETTDGAAPKQAGMSLPQFQELTKGNKLVLVDFNAEWCAPCKKMLPMIEEISTSMQDKVKVEKIDVDVNSELATTLKVESIPMFIMYKNGTEVWKHLGLIEKDKLIEAINQNSK
jgi:thioredoxin 1